MYQYRPEVIACVYPSAASLERILESRANGVHTEKLGRLDFCYERKNVRFGVSETSSIPPSVVPSASVAVDAGE